MNLLQAVCSDFTNFLLSQLSIVQLDLIYRATCIDIPRSQGSLADDHFPLVSALMMLFLLCWFQ